MEDEKKQQLFPYFAFLYSKQINPDKYGEVEDFEEWKSLIEGDQEALEQIGQAAQELSDEEWVQLEAQLQEQDQQTSSQDLVAQFAKNGAKLNNLKKLKAYKKGGKKCKCGCEMTNFKEDGGKIVSKCACGCNDVKKPSKKEIGGVLEKVKSFNTKYDEMEDFKQYAQKWDRRIKSQKVRKFKG